MESILKKYFGYSTFRDYQKTVIEKILEKDDCLVVMATGSGKSLWKDNLAINSMEMARLNSFSVVVTMLLACGVTFLSPGLASRVLSSSESEAPGYYDETDLAPIEAFQDFPPEPLATDPNSEFLEVCSKRLTPDCGESIFKNVFADDSMPVEDNCCLLLVSMGRTCHYKLVDNTINKIPDYKSNETITRLRSVQIWNKCALLADNAVPQTASPIED